MARPSHLNELKQHFLLMEKYCQHPYGLKPYPAAIRVVRECGRRLPGRGTKESNVDSLRKHHRENRDDLRLMLAKNLEDWPERRPGDPVTYVCPIVTSLPQRVTLARRLFRVMAALVKNPKR